MDSLARAAIAAERSVDVASLPPRTVAVPPMEVVAADSTMGPLGFGLADLLSTDLAQTHQLTVVDRLRLEAVLRELRLAASGVVDSQSAPRMGRILGARRLIVGSLATFPDSQIQITLQLADVATGAVTPVQSGRTPIDRVVDAEVELAYRVYEALGITLTPAERAAIAANATRNFGALMAYSRGVRDEAYGEYASAAANYRNAVQADPKFSAAQTRLTIASNVQASSSSQEAPSSQSKGDTKSNGPAAPASSSVSSAVNTANVGINPSGVDYTAPTSSSGGSGNNSSGSNPAASVAQNNATTQASPVTHTPIITTLVITIRQLP